MSGFGFEGFGFTPGVLGSGFRVSGLGLRVSSSGYQSGIGFRVSGFWFRVSGFGFRVSGFGFQASGFGVHYLAVVACFVYRVSGSGFVCRVSGSGFRVQLLGNVRFGYRGISLIRNHPPVGPYSSPMRRDLW